MTPTAYPAARRRFSGLPPTMSFPSKAVGVVSGNSGAVRTREKSSPGDIEGASGFANTFIEVSARLAARAGYHVTLARDARRLRHRRPDPCPCHSDRGRGGAATDRRAGAMILRPAAASLVANRAAPDMPRWLPVVSAFLIDIATFAFVAVVTIGHRSRSDG